MRMKTRCRITHLRTRTATILTFPNRFWKKGDNFFSKIFHTHRRVYWFICDDGYLNLGFVDPKHLPMGKVKTRFLQYGGRDDRSLKVTIPALFVRQFKIKELNCNAVMLHRVYGFMSMFFRCEFGYMPVKFC